MVLQYAHLSGKHLEEYAENSKAVTDLLHLVKMCLEKYIEAIEFIGGASGTRTLDLWIKSPLLYQLS